MRLAFLGTPEASVRPLRALVEAGHDIAIVVTQPDKRRGRGGQLVPSPVAQAAAELGLPVTSKVDDVLGIGVELGVVVAFGRLIKPHVLAEVPMVNIHFSLLPRWRGAAPVERAILAGDAETGVCLMALEEGLDTGPVYEVGTVAIGREETADELRDRLVEVGTEILVRRLTKGFPSLGAAVPQTGEPTYAAKLEPEEHHIDWWKPAVDVHRVVRVGGAWTTFRGKRLHIVRAELWPDPPAVPGSQTTLPGTLEGTGVFCGDGELIQLIEVKPEGKGVQPAAAWRNGARPQPGEQLGG